RIRVRLIVVSMGWIWGLGTKTSQPSKRIRRKLKIFGTNPSLPPPRLAGQERGRALFQAETRIMQDNKDTTAKNWALGLTSLASFMMALDAMIITTAFATIRAEFGSTVETLQWSVNAFNLAFAVLLLSGAALGDRFGRRRMFAAGIALFVVASAACALAGNAAAL